MTFRPPMVTRILQGIALILGLSLTFAGSVIGIYLAQFGLFFTLIAFVVVAWLLWFMCRKSYAIAFQNNITVSDKGISWHYLGVSGFSVWQMVEAFDISIERAWLNLTFSTSDFRTARIRVLGRNFFFPLQEQYTIGIRLRENADLKSTWLSNLPKSSHDFIPISLITGLPRHRDKSLDVEKLISTKLGRELLYFAPHLFEDYEDWKPKNRLRDDYAENETPDWLAEASSKQKVRK